MSNKKHMYINSWDEDLLLLDDSVNLSELEVMVNKIGIDEKKPLHVFLYELYSNPPQYKEIMTIKWVTLTKGCDINEVILNESMTLDEFEDKHKLLSDFVNWIWCHQDDYIVARGEEYDKLK